MPWRGVKISGSDELLASVYRHDIISSLNVFRSAREGEQYDVIGVWDLEEEQRSELYDAVDVLDRTYQKLDRDDTSLEDVEEEVSTLAGYEDRFDGEVGERIDQIAALSECINHYINEYDVNEEEEVSINEVLMPLEEYGVDVSYNGNGDSFVVGDPGLSLVSNTIGANGIEHGKEDDSYQMWAQVGELPESYEIEIWDNGSGIPDDIDRENVFDKGVGSNTGKGLYLSKEIVELFGGSIELSEELEEEEGGFGLRMQLEKSSS